MRWTDPSGATHGGSAVKRLDRPYVGSVLDVRDAAPGLWTAEALFDDDVIDRRTFRVRSSGSRTGD